MTSSAYSLILSIKNILDSEVDPLLETYSNENPQSPELLAVLSRLNDIHTLISNQRPAYYGLFTCESGQTVTANNQIIPFSVSTGGTIIPNADGTFTLPANTKWLIDIDINGVFSYSSYVTFVLYDADSGTSLLTFYSVSENYNNAQDFPEIRVAEYVIGSTPRRFGVKVQTKQSLGTFTLTQYSSYIKIQEV